MTSIERKIEAALDAHFQAEGWSLDTRGDHLADWFQEHDEGGGYTTTVNLTAVAKAVAAEIS